MCELILRFDGGVFVVFIEEKRRNETEEEEVESEDDEMEGLDEFVVDREGEEGGGFVNGGGGEKGRD